jgi:hypothetical protein
MKQLISLMENVNAGVFFEQGLGNSEIAEAEETFHFEFPQDLREFLQLALPVGSFPNWRSDPKEKLQGLMDWPLEGMLFDLRSNAFWLSQWGKRPDDLDEAEFDRPREVCCGTDSHTRIRTSLHSCVSACAGQSDLFRLSDGHYLLRFRSR